MKPDTLVINTYNEAKAIVIKSTGESYCMTHKKFGIINFQMYESLLLKFDSYSKGQSFCPFI